ncbi:hypothetical protein D2E23_0945 [Bifidobacterium callimiconis]|uniref:Uncharacterized protein n=2 Tax=Bifidobacterium TaxID=1678 RepID=A0A430FE51_9BIFI|nr:hypothetical protein Tam10B_1024 [Bifidobacterium vansinderenii]RSX51100.1 hypothetical protein D2E23_0945 [Bifidobacterium callimiconis]
MQKLGVLRQISTIPACFSEISKWIPHDFLMTFASDFAFKEYGFSVYRRIATLCSYE